MNISEMIGMALRSAKKKEPEICIGAGIGCSVAALIMGVAATPKAMRRLEKKKEEKEGRPLTTTDKIRTAGPCYIPAIATEALGIGMILQGNRLHEKNTAALATLYAVTDGAFRDFKESVKEAVGERKAEQMEGRAAERRINREPMPEEYMENPETNHPGHGDVRCFEPFCGRYFWSDRESIERAVNKLNHQMITNFVPYISLNEFYMEINLPTTEAGDKLGWNADKGLIEVSFRPKLKDGRYPCMVVTFTDDGKPDYGFEYA